MRAMECTDPKKLATYINVAACAKEGSLTWPEFLNFFFLRNASFADRIDANDWWNKIDENGKSIPQGASQSGPLSSKSQGENSRTNDIKHNR